ncbi:hypothetical protein COCC4DRAFT_25295 [Bipolaris maydis ATCC 48331]|uniref:Uncharacterized protein n=2 Tax=Cochliobolus heterostrophus TaxID=5016 RepID=M2TY57_COCH5|nr:uncharacterized protein COCC4DRAFT_25295 [Bipolaris maydis ATCC 48331]EMD86716.1 hypothetical protein COCHEDRAFT_1034488 [Bipolaris maydis C5]ENI03107.1 hypothetical protein COCC4DRAFT_25295 [Bipolaris maydis ATCC 48331]
MTQSLSPSVMTTTPKQSKRSCYTVFIKLLKLVSREPRTTADCEPKSASSSASTFTNHEKPPTPIQYNQDPTNISTSDITKEGLQQEIPKADGCWGPPINIPLSGEVIHIQTTDSRAQNKAIGTNRFPFYLEGSTSCPCMDCMAYEIKCLQIKNATAEYWDEKVKSCLRAKTPY